VQLTAGQVVRELIEPIDAGYEISNKCASV